MNHLLLISRSNRTEENSLSKIKTSDNDLRSHCMVQVHNLVNNLVNI